MSIHNEKAHPALVIAALVLIQVLFGVNYVISKVVVDQFHPLLWASLRIMIATVIMFTVAIVLRRPHPTDGIKFFGPLVGYALLGIIINQACFLVGLHHTTPSNSAILNTLTPIFTLLIVVLRGQEKAGMWRVIGFVFALSGVLVLRRVEDFHVSNQTALGDLLTIVNCLSFSFFLSFSKRFLEKYDQVWATAWLFFYGSIGLTILALPQWLHATWPTMTPELLGCSTYAILGGTLLTYFLNNWTLKHGKQTHVALFIYIQPVVAMTLAWFWRGEAITLRTAASCLLIFVGVLLALAKEQKTYLVQGART